MKKKVTLLKSQKFLFTFLKISGLEAGNPLTKTEPENWIGLQAENSNCTGGTSVSNFNRVFLMGNLTHDPELKLTPNGTTLAKFSVGVNRSYKGSDGELKKQTDFFKIVVWGKPGENCGKYLSKGRPVHIEGRLQTRSYETLDHQKRTITEIVANNVQFMGTRDRYGSPAPSETTSFSSDEQEDTTVPF